jgi:hypothetical protein
MERPDSEAKAAAAHIQQLHGA